MDGKSDAINAKVINLEVFVDVEERGVTEKFLEIKETVDNIRGKNNEVSTVLTNKLAVMQLESKDLRDNLMQLDYKVQEDLGFQSDLLSNLENRIVIREAKIAKDVSCEIRSLVSDDNKRRKIDFAGKLGFDRNVTRNKSVDEVSLDLSQVADNNEDASFLRERSKIKGYHPSFFLLEPNVFKVMF